MSLHYVLKEILFRTNYFHLYIFDQILELHSCSVVVVAGSSSVGVEGAGSDAGLAPGGSSRLGTTGSGSGAGVGLLGVVVMPSYKK